MKLGQYITDDDVWEIEPYDTWEENYLFWAKKYMQEKVGRLSTRFLQDESSFDLLVDSIERAKNIDEIKDVINDLSKIKVKGAKSYFIAIYKFFYFLKKVEAKKITQIENKVIKAFVIYLGSEENPVNDVTKNNMLVRIKNFLIYISNHNSTDGEVFDFKITIAAKDILKQKQKRIEIISPDKEYAEFLKGVDEITFKHDNIRNKLFLKIALFTGMRISEIAYIKYKDIEIDSKNFAFNIIGKGNKERTLYVNKRDIMDLWTLYIKERPITSPDNYAFANSKGEPLADRTVSNYVRKILELKNIKTTKKSLHLIRHSLCTKLIYNGEHSLEDVSALLGHESISTTQIYSHITDEHIKKTTKGISSVINKDYKKKKAE